MSKPIYLLTYASMLLLASAASAEMCTMDPSPAATLLLPYFEVDLASSDGITTLFSINNGTANAALANVTLWTNWSKPTMNFNVFFTGFDVVTVNLRDLFGGQLPITADQSRDTEDSISPHGDNPGWDGSFAHCSEFLPFGDDYLGPTILSRLINGHTGKPVSEPDDRDLCLGDPSFGDDIARGWITVDSVSECSMDIANDINYFIDGGTGVANNKNIFWGDFLLIDPMNNFAFGESLVSIEAADGFNAGSTTTGLTFYGRWTSPYGGADNREPLGTVWAHRYLNGGAFDGGTDLIVWRDPTNSSSVPESCEPYAPVWAPLNENEVTIYDESEDTAEICFSLDGENTSPPDPEIDPTCFPLSTQRVAFGEGDLALPFDFGWARLDLNIEDAPNPTDVDFGPRGDIAQSYVISTLSALGRFQVGFAATELSHACGNIDSGTVDREVTSP